jgi:serine/threonine protein kinase
MGSPRYMSPEQMRSTRAIDARADIWALGVILHELITGASPFDGTTMPELLAAILQDPPPPLRAQRPEAPQGLEAVVARCLEKDPDARYADVAELTQALAPFGSASARVSAERVSRVIRPRLPSDTSTSAPIVRATIPAPSEFRQEPPTDGTVTVSATADAWGATGVPVRSKARTVALAIGGGFFGISLLVAMFSGRPQPSAARTGGSLTPATPAVAPPPMARESEPSFETLDLAPAPPVVGSAPPPRAASSSDARPAPTTPARRRSASGASAATAAGAPVATGEPDLFDGRK